MLQGDVIAVETSNSMVRLSLRLVTLVGMKDVIVIDKPDALLVTRVGHCQSVKKVAEFLKTGNRIEAEQHQSAKAEDVATPYGGMAPLFMSDSRELVSVTIQPGQSSVPDAVDNRDMVVSRGDIIVSTLKSSAVQGRSADGP